MDKSSSVNVILEELQKSNKEKIHFVLRKKKTLSEEVITKLQNQIDFELEIFMKSIAPNLKNMTFDDPEKSLKLIILEAMKKILDEIGKSCFEDLSIRDKNIFQEIFEALENSSDLKDNMPVNQNIQNPSYDQNKSKK